MPEREQIRKGGNERSTGSEVADESLPDSAKGERLKAELDELLDEIDDVLETNAEDFVKSYVQKGGQ